MKKTKKELIGHCEDCGNPIYDGDMGIYLEGDDVYICSECIELERVEE